MKLLSFWAITAMVMLSVFLAQAEEVSSTDAARAASAWVERGRKRGTFRGGHGSRGVLRTTEHRIGSEKVFAVDLLDGSSVLVAGESEFDPVIAYSTEGDGFAKIDPKGPLFALLQRDLASRRAELKSRAVVRLRPSHPRRPQRARDIFGRERTAKDEWRELVSEGASMEQASFGFSALSFASLPPVDAVTGGLRVEYLIKSLWDQKGPCYNYYTPHDASGEIAAGAIAINTYCGCVATAMSQVMYCHQHPVKADPEKQFAWPWWDVLGSKGGILESRWLKNLVVSGEEYNWAAMENRPTNPGSSNETLRAIGRLTADAGYSVGMRYMKDGSGAYDLRVAKAFRDVFNYPSALFCGVEDNAIDAYLENVILANLDAGCPVMLGIIKEGSDSGHAVCADGYGFVGGLCYVHLNMGWSGSNNMWYHLPDMNTAGYDVISDITYNISPDLGNRAILSGRVIDSDQEGFGGASVKVFRAGTQALVTNVLANAHGVWAAFLPAGYYDLEVTDPDGVMTGRLESVSLSTPSWLYELGFNVTAGDENGNVGFYNSFSDYVVSDPEYVGNSWGNDIELRSPSVRIFHWEELESAGEYDTLDQALNAAVEGDTLEIFKPTRLRLSKLTKIPVSCKLCLSDDCESALAPITLVGGRALTIAAGAQVEFYEGVAFKSNEPGDLSLEVQKGAQAAFGGDLGFKYISTKTADALKIMDEISVPVYVDCKVNNKVTSASDQFAVPGRENLANLNFFLHNTDEGLGGMLSQDHGRIIWGDVDLPDEAAAVQVVAGGGHTNYRSLAGALKNLPIAGDFALMICKDVAFDGSLKVASGRNISIYSSPAVSATITTVVDQLDLTKCSSIVCEAGGELVISNVVFTGQVMEDFIYIDKGTVTLEKGATFDQVVTARKGPNKATHGWFTLVDGATLNMKSGSLFNRCKANVESGVGGAIYSMKSTLNLEGGRIVNCYAAKAGGGVYFYDGAVNLGGDIVIQRNWSAAHDPDNLYNEHAKNVIKVGELKAEASVGVLSKITPNSSWIVEVGNKTNEVFATLAEGVSPSPTILAAFSNDLDDEGMIEAAAGENGTLVWAKRLEDDLEVDPSEAVVKVEYDEEEGTYHYFARFADAITKLKGAATISLLTEHVVFSESIEITRPVRLQSDPDAGSCNLERTSSSAVIAITAGGALVVSNVTIRGEYYNPSDHQWHSEGDADRLLSVDGGELDLQAGATVGHLSGRVARGSSAIAVYNCGRLTMRDGACVTSSHNRYANPDKPDTEFGVGGGILVDSGEFHFLGGEVKYCSAKAGGGVYVGNGGEIFLSGAPKVWYNYNLQNEFNNLAATKRNIVHLDGELSSEADIGFTPTDFGDTAEFGDVTWATDDFNVVGESAARIHRDDDAGNVAVAVTNVVSALPLLVWQKSLVGGAGGYVYDRVDDQGKVVRYYRDVPAGMMVAMPPKFNDSLFSFGNSERQAEGEEEAKGEADEVMLCYADGKAGCIYMLKEATSLSSKDTFTVAETQQPKQDGPVVFKRNVSADFPIKFWVLDAVEGLIQRPAEKSAPTAAGELQNAPLKLNFSR